MSPIESLWLQTFGNSVLAFSLQDFGDLPPGNSITYHTDHRDCQLKGQDFNDCCLHGFVYLLAVVAVAESSLSHDSFSNELCQNTKLQQIR
mmetsp:Transcript_577/g.741  ORF Transcript_577/g.741 Transcript_577/m.741 type:complete len:91 (+) Transcript_577:685-957(+)